MERKISICLGTFLTGVTATSLLFTHDNDWKVSLPLTLICILFALAFDTGRREK